jgi:hypothetical protein
VNFRLATSIQSDRDHWLAQPELAAKYDRLRVYETPSLNELVKPGGPWHGRTWSYVNVMASTEWGWPAENFPKEVKPLTLGRTGSWRMGYDPAHQVAMDVRNGHWQSFVARKCASQVSLGHKGVFLDDVNLVPDLRMASALWRPVRAPKDWARGMVQLVTKVRAYCPSAEIVINLPPSQVAWNGQFVEWTTFLTAEVRALLDLGVILEVERGFSDPNIKESAYAVRGLAWVLENVRPWGTRVVLDQQSGDAAWEMTMYNEHAQPGIDWVAPLLKEGS